MSICFIQRDYCNEIRCDGRTWEVAHPKVFEVLFMRPTSYHWSLFASEHPLSGLSFAQLTLSTSLGMADIWVVCEHPVMFAHLPCTVDEWCDWWFKWGQTPILISCPIQKLSSTEDATQLWKSWSIWSSSCVLCAPQHDFQMFLTQGCFGIASGQTAVLAMHRHGTLTGPEMLSILHQWDAEIQRFYGQEGRILPSEDWFMEPQEKMWLMLMTPATECFIHYSKSNVFIGDYPALYTSYGYGMYSPALEVQTYLWEKTISLAPIYPHIAGQLESHLSVMVLPFYSKWLKNPSRHWETRWNQIQPFLNDMSFRRVRETLDPEHDILQTIRCATPSPYAIDTMVDLFLDLRSRSSSLSSLGAYMDFLKKEYTLTLGAWIYRLMSVPFAVHRYRRSDLEAYWDFIRSYYIVDSEDWNRWVVRIFIYLQTSFDSMVPWKNISWRFLHWVFQTPSVSSVSSTASSSSSSVSASSASSTASASASYHLRLFHPISVVYRGSPYQCSIYDVLKGIPSFPVSPYLKMFRERVLKPRIQGRLRVFHQFKRVSPEVADVWYAYVQRYPDIYRQ